MRFALWVNPLRDRHFEMRDKVISLIEKEGAEWTLEEAEFGDCDLLLSLGGDGTFLSTAHLETARDLPCIGLNLGSVGFLTELDQTQVEDAIPRLCRGEYRVEDRMMLEAEIYSRDGRLVRRQTALNDLVVSRKGRIVSVDLSINGEPVEEIPGDGLIVSTSTGSTAYSLAAGGPIVHPSLSVFIITPICPHSLHNRSYVAASTAEIRLGLRDPEAPAIVCSDGRDTVELCQGTVLIRRAGRVFRMIHLYQDRFYQKLPGKIQKRGMT